MRENETLENERANMEQVRIPTESGQSLHGTFVAGQRSSESAILLVHGWMSKTAKYHEMAPWLSIETGASCLAIDLRGHGNSDGDIKTVTPADNLVDVQAAFGWLSYAPDCKITRFAGFGVSYGGYLMALASRTVNLEALALRAPALYPNETFLLPTNDTVEGMDLFEYRKSSRKNDAFDAIAEFEGDLFIAASENDEQVPRATTDRYARAAKQCRTLDEFVIPDADHALSEDAWRVMFNIRLRKWLFANL